MSREKQLCVLCLIIRDAIYQNVIEDMIYLRLKEFLDGNTFENCKIERVIDVASNQESVLIIIYQIMGFMMVDIKCGEFDDWR